MYWIAEAQEQIDIAFKENFETEQDALDQLKDVWESYDEFCDTFYEEF